MHNCAFIIEVMKLCWISLVKSLVRWDFFYPQLPGFVFVQGIIPWQNKNARSFQDVPETFSSNCSELQQLYKKFPLKKITQPEKNSSDGSGQL